MTTTTSEKLANPASRTSSRRFRSGALVRVLTFAILLVTASFAALLVNAQESTPAATPTPEVTPAPDMPRLELELTELNDSGINGTVTLYDAGDQTIVEYDAEGAGGDHPTHIHQGVCGELEPEPAFLLENVDENGESTTVIDVTLDELLDEDHAIDMHLAPNELGTLIACADIAGEPTVPEGTGTPVATPIATPDEIATPTPDDEESDGTGGAITTIDPTEAAILDDETAVATETPVETETPVATEAATIALTDVTTPEPTTAPTEKPATPDKPDDTGGVVNGVLPGVTGVPTPTPTEAAREPIEGDGTAGVSGKGKPIVGITDASPVVSGDGTGGVAGKGEPIGASTMSPAVSAGDGTAGVSGKGEPVGATALPQQAGVGASLAWPESPAMAVMWASMVAAAVLATSAWIVRRGEQQSTDTPSRWTRLGL